MIKNIVFDMGGVLIDFIWEKVYRERGLSGDVLEKVAKATVYSEQWVECDRDVLTHDEICELFIKNDPTVEKEIRIAFHHMGEMIKKFSYSDEWVKSFKDKGYKIFILSNFSREAYYECGDNLSFTKYADGQIISCDHKLVKPDREIYEKLLSEYNLKADECVFMDDVLKNVEGAKRAGLHAFVFENVEDAKVKLRELGVDA